MNENRKQRLVGLGAEGLADALLELAVRDDAADDLVERLIATPVENIQRLKAKLASLKRSRRSVPWGESAAFARELGILLQDLRAGVDDPQTGSELAASFFETDKATFEHCDDSTGSIGDVYRFDAKELFVGYARLCPDKERLADLVLKLNRDDDYGVRDTLIDSAAQYLPEPNIRALISKLQKAADQEQDEYEQRHWLNLIESLARQVGDAQLFEKTRIASWGELSTAACVDIARVYLESGDARTALSWLEKISPDETFQDGERDRLLVTILGQIGDKRRQEEVAWRIFRRYRSKDSLEDLLSLIGGDLRESVTMGEAGSILAKESLSLSDAAFLVETGRVEEAERYLLERVDQLNGDFYGSLLPLAEAMEADARHLAATVVYRALLDSILRRGQSKTYPHGVRYLNKLERLEESVTDWCDQMQHDVYLQRLRQRHGRKFSFWSRYEK